MITTQETTVAVSGLTTVEFDRRYPFYGIRNDSSSAIQVSTVNAECVEGADGVVTVAKDSSFVIANCGGTMLYLNGNGTVTVVGQYSDSNRFKVAQKGGGETVDITPTSLGYTPGAKIFYDGIYNFPPKHATNGNTWVDMVNSQTMNRYTDGSGSGLIASNHYIKQTGIATAMKIPDMIDYDRFTVELFVEITGGTTGENDIISNFDKAGFGIYTENGQLNASIRSEASASYLNIATAFSQNTSYGLAITYDGQAFNFYVNGALVGTKTLSDYKKSTKNTYLGCLGAGDTNYAVGAYNFYRLAAYSRALTAAEIAQNYEKDVKRYVDGEPDFPAEDETEWITSIAENHNNIFRGDDLFAKGYDINDICAMISDGSFSDIYIGDYFTLSGDIANVPCFVEQTGDDGTKSLVESTQTVTYNTKFRVAGLDTYLNTGDTAFTQHHAVIVPDKNIGTNRMNSTNTAVGGYVNSFMFASVLPVYNTHFDVKLNNHLLTHREILSSSATNSTANNWEWHDIKINLMSEPEVYGSNLWGNKYDAGVNYRQFPLFRIASKYICDRNWCWLKAVAGGNEFVAMTSNGNATRNGAGVALAVRPCFCIG
ncbi:LamG domain-containing protein [Huintestinicola butyrica]|uniref:LamG domain-containing protein n=1 Tax=Huintestinicola butyrica TaxID=2981728 RepID=UPI003F7D361F